MLEKNKTYCLDCLEGLKSLENDSVDLLITDPPYGLEFMQKDWDRAVPPVIVWEECLRVLKPGSFAFIMSSPRQDVQAQMISRLSKAGFEVGFTPIYWTYASGFPKAQNISKAISKKQGAKKQGAGSKGKTFPLNKEYQDYELTEDAKLLDGSYAGFQPKPAVEVILVVMKPLSENTYLEQALDSGKGVTWLDNCRIPYKNKNDKEAAAAREHQQQRCNEEKHNTVSLIINDSRVGKNPQEEYDKYMQSQGRFPANLLVSDEVLNDGKVTKANPHPRTNSPDNANVYGHYAKHTDNGGWNDSGGFSRYFDLDAWYIKKLNELPESVRKTYPFLLTPKPSKKEKNRYLTGNARKRWNKGGVGTGITAREEIIAKNFHSTVKPIKLGSYLITLGSKEKDLILDPFIGSGTFGISATLTNRNFIGFENNPDYQLIATKRISTHKKRQELKNHLNKKKISNG